MDNNEAQQKSRRSSKRIAWGVVCLSGIALFVGFIIFSPRFRTAQPARLDLTPLLWEAGGSPERPANNACEVLAYEFSQPGLIERFHGKIGITNLRIETDCLAFDASAPECRLAWDCGMEATSVSHLEITLAMKHHPEHQGITWQRSGETQADILPLAFLAPQGEDFHDVIIPLENDSAWSGKITRMGVIFRFPESMADPVPVSIQRIRLLRLAPGNHSGSTRLTQAVIDNESRLVVHAPSPSRLSREVTIPENARLDFAVGVHPSNHNKPGDGVFFRIRFCNRDGQETPLYTRSVDIKSRPEHRRWFDETLDLSALSRQKGNLIFETLGSVPTSRPDERFDDALWAHPLLSGPVPDKNPLNVVLLSLDTLRADHLGCYGYDRKTSPHLDALAQNGILFENAYAHAPETISSHMTLFTSLYPSTHGIHLTREGRCLAQGVPTLAAVLKQAGYTTAAFTEGCGVSSHLGFDRGFDRYHNGTPSQERPHKMIEGTFGKAQAWLRANAEKRFFLFFHTYEVHTPYHPPAPHDSAFDTRYEGPLKPPIYADPVRDMLRCGEITHGSPEVDRIVSLYDGEIAYLDTFVGRLRDTLRDLNLMERTLIVILSDHGEDFLDHFSLAGHGHSLYEELVRVPLILCLPDTKEGAPDRIPRPVGLIDVTPTLLEYLRIPLPPGLQGRSLLPLLNGDSLPERPVFMEDLTLIERYGVRSGTRKRIYSPKIEEHPLLPLIRSHASTLGLERFQGLFEEEEEFDLNRDPGETRNLLSAEPEGRETPLGAKLQDWMRAIESGPHWGGDPAPMDSATLDRLRALGYLH